MNGPDLDALAKQHGCELIAFADASGAVRLVCKKPGRIAFRSYRTACNTNPGAAEERLVFDCAVWPDAVGLDALAEALPGLVCHAGVQLAHAAGFGQAARLGKSES